MAKCTKSCFVILGLLSKADLSGYDLKVIMAKHAKFYWSESNAQIYPVLKKLEAQGLVTSHLDKSSGERQKRIYSITPEGLDRLMEWLHDSTDLTAYREEILLKVGLGQHMDNQEMRQMIDNYREQVVERLAQHAAVVEHITSKHDDRPDKPYLFMVYDHVGRVLQAKLDWCDDILQQLA